jgi:2-methylcitrate dehydratase PrpD
MAGVSRELAAFAVETRTVDFPDEVLHAARRSLLNGFATAIAGSRDPAIDIAWTVQQRFAGPATCSLIGRAARTDLLTAAFLNAAAMNVHDFDDTHLRTVIHPTAPVAPALLALAETREIDGRDFLAALALGIEAACRIGNAVSPGHYGRGWHITATCGVFGAALAAGRLLGLDADRMLNALGSASAQASGLVETLGFMAKSIGVGAACRGGLMAALLAEEGLDGPERPLEGPRGFLTVTGEAPDLEEVTGGLGVRWEALRNIHKPYPCGIVLNAVIDACLDLRSRPGFRADAVRTVTLHGNPLLAQRADRPGVTTGRESQVSAQHAVAVALNRGGAGLADFGDAAVADPVLVAYRDRVRLVDDPAIPVPAIRLVAEMADGEVVEVGIADARGTDNNPLTDVEIETKLRTLAAEAHPGWGGADALIDAVWNLGRGGGPGGLAGLGSVV